MANAYAPTFSELVDEVQDICENTNDEFVDNIPKFIHRAQDQIQKDLGLSLWRDYFDLSISTAEIARDTDWLIVKSIWLPDEEKFLEQRTVDYVRRCGGTGRPKYWAEDMENTIIVAPTPDAPYDATVEFYARLAALSEANETNWITRNAGDLLLVQTLLNAGIYLVANELSLIHI